MTRVRTMGCRYLHSFSFSSRDTPQTPFDVPWDGGYVPIQKERYTSQPKPKQGRQQRYWAFSKRKYSLDDIRTTTTSIPTSRMMSGFKSFLCHHLFQGWKRRLRVTTNLRKEPHWKVTVRMTQLCYKKNVEIGNKTACMEPNDVQRTGLFRCFRNQRKGCWR